MTGIPCAKRAHRTRKRVRVPCTLMRSRVGESRSPRVRVRIGLRRRPRRISEPLHVCPWHSHYPHARASLQYRPSSACPPTLSSAHGLPVLVAVVILAPAWRLGVRGRQGVDTGVGPPFPFISRRQPVRQTKDIRGSIYMRSIER